MRLLSILPLLLLVSCNLSLMLGKAGISGAPGVSDQAPVASAVSASDGMSRDESTIVLNYIDADGDLANSCTLSNLSNLTETTPCACDVLGVCSVGVTGIGFYSGAVSFDFTVTASGAESNTASASFNLQGRPFVSVWRTTAPNESISLPVSAGYTFNADVDWGDGSAISEITSDIDADKTHIYATAGDYTVTITGTFQAMNFSWGGSNLNLISIPDLGDVGWTSFEYAFRNCTNLTTVAGGNTSAVLSMKGMFYGATLATVDSSGWDTSNVINMSQMFSTARAANPDTSGWDTSSVTNMSEMFFQADVATPDTSEWITSSVTNMSGMFWGALVANPDTSQWITDNVLYMNNMFISAALAEPDTSGWNTSNVLTMEGMFNSATAANPDTSGWDTSNVVSMRAMFAGASSANPDVSGWNTANVVNMSFLFQYILPSATPNVVTWNFASATNMTSMFQGLTLPTATYSNVLNRINATSAQSNVAFHGGGSLYNAGSAASRANLVSRSWTITDGGAE